MNIRTLATYSDNQNENWIGILRNGDVTSHDSQRSTLKDSIFDFRSWILNFNSLQVSFPNIPKDCFCQYDTKNKSFKIHGVKLSKVLDDDEKNNVVFLEQSPNMYLNGSVEINKNIVTVRLIEAEQKVF